MDYLNIKYNNIEKPITNYPLKFAEYNFDRFNLKNKKVLEIGSGRGEFANEFSNLGNHLSWLPALASSQSVSATPPRP